MSSDGNFVGTVVLVYLSEPARGAMLENVAMRQIGGRDFLVGKLARQEDSDPRSGKETWCALDHVQMLVIFPDLPAAREYYDTFKRKKRAKKEK